MKVNNENHLPSIEFTPTKQKRFESNKYAKMEPKTARIRERLAKRLVQQDQKFTEQALLAAKVNMIKWLERHRRERVPLKNNASHSFFSGGKATAEISASVQAVRTRISSSFDEARRFLGKETTEQATKELQGRVKKTNG